MSKCRKPNGPSKALKLGGRQKDTENFVDQLKSEGEHVVNSNVTSAIVKGGPLINNKIPATTIATEPYVTSTAIYRFLEMKLSFFLVTTRQVRVYFVNHGAVKEVFLYHHDVRSHFLSFSRSLFII